MLPSFDYRPEYARYRDEVAEAVQRVLDSGWLILGPEVRAFEEEFAAFVGVSAAVGVNSGTDALWLAFKALGIGPGDDVLTVANAGVPPVAAIRAVGATPRFVDVDPRTLLMDPDRLERARTATTRCVVPVHLYGHPAPIGPIRDFTRRHGLFLVEDCAQAHGATWNGRPVGSFGDVGCFSFYPTKNLGAFGDGGMCVTGDADLAQKLEMLRFYGFRGDRHAHCEGLNSRLDELQAAILRVKLRHLSAATEERRAIAASYGSALAGADLVLPVEIEACRHVYHLFVVQSDARERLARALEAAGIGFGLHYPEPVHTMEAYRFLAQGEGALPVTERACRQVLSLPLYPGLEAGAVERVVAALKGA